MALAPLSVRPDLSTSEERQMKRENQWALLTMAIAFLAMVGTAFCLNPSSSMQYPTNNAYNSRPIMRSVVKVHTDHGVITMPGNADSWAAAERAVFVADSIADVQIANSEIPWRISFE
jgi:hypothetical protein